MPNVKSKPVRLKLSDKGEIAKTRAAAEIIEEMNKAGISGDGTPFPPGVTKQVIDMHDTGRLHRDFEVYTTRLQYKAPYAELLQKKYNWCGIPTSGPWREKYEARVQELIKGEVSLSDN